MFAGSLDIINFVARMLIWSLLVLVALDNLGVNITALLAGLGVGGVAVALALQNALGDLFASLSIARGQAFCDRRQPAPSIPIIGKVEHIGIKTTRLRSDRRRANHFVECRYPEESRAQFRRAVGTADPGDHSPKIRHPGGQAQGAAATAGKRRARAAEARFERCHLITLGDECVSIRAVLLRAASRR